jgi:fatty acid desaturase
MNLKMLNKYALFVHLIAAACFAAAAFVNGVNGVIFVAVITAILVPLNLFLSYEAFKKMIKEK